MPGIDGLRLLAEIHKIDPELDTIMITGQTGTYTYSDIIKAGAADFMAKPFQLSELKAKMERIGRERKMPDGPQGNEHYFGSASSAGRERQRNTE